MSEEKPIPKADTCCLKRAAGVKDCCIKGTGAQKQAAYEKSLTPQQRAMKP